MISAASRTTTSGEAGGATPAGTVADPAIDRSGGGLADEEPRVAQPAAADPVRRALLDAAARLLAEHGPDGVSVRALSRAAGQSTKSVYTRFDGKGGIVRALYDEGFADLTATMSAAADTPGASARLRLARAAGAYRRFAREQPHRYELMYGTWVRDLLPAPTDRRPATAAMGVLVELFHLAAENGSVTPSDPASQAGRLLAAMHGAVSLELTGWFPPEEGERHFRALVARLLDDG